MLSLRHRALVGSLASGLISVAIGVLSLNTYVDNRIQDRFEANLRDRHTQVVVALSLATEDPEVLRDLIFDPAYSTPYSGRYWQVSSAYGEVYTSASLFDQTLEEPVRNASGMIVWDSLGPETSSIRAVNESIAFDDGIEWSITVAEDLTGLMQERSEMRQSLLLVFSLVAVIGLAGSILSLTTILWPLRKLRQDVANRWHQDKELSPEDYPEEVSPLVQDINDLMHRNRDIVTGARRQAADLAHALKTPSAILRNELEGQPGSAFDREMAVEALDRIDAQLGRSLARMRTANSAELTNSSTDISNSVERFGRLFASMAEREGKSVVCRNTPDLRVRMDTQDIEEVIGNLLDNALKWSRNVIQITNKKTPEGVMLLIEDDGSGIPKQSQREALRAGGRLDSSKPGTGLGLAIAVDLLKAYGADLSIDRSENLGGLAVRVEIPNRFERKVA